MSHSAESVLVFCMCSRLPHAEPGHCGRCRYDGTVRGAGGNIVQFLYGEDGMDATCIEEQTLDFLRMKQRDFKVPPAPSVWH